MFVTLYRLPNKLVILKLMVLNNNRCKYAYHANALLHIRSISELFNGPERNNVFIIESVSMKSIVLNLNSYRE
jgi:hypothetical protein